MSDILPDSERDRHYHNIGRISVMFAACEDHAARLVFVRREQRLPQENEHLKLAASSWKLREALKEVDPTRAAELETFSDYRNRLAHSLFRYDVVETDPDEHGVALIEGFTEHRMLHPRTGETTKIPSEEEIEERYHEMNAWCRATWVRFRELAGPDPMSRDSH